MVTGLGDYAKTLLLGFYWMDVAILTSQLLLMPMVLLLTPLISLRSWTFIPGKYTRAYDATLDDMFSEENNVNRQRLQVD